VNGDHERRGLLIPSLAALLALAVLLALGTWQLERKAWKEALIATLADRLAAPPIALPAPSEWPELDPVKAEFRRVALRGEFLPTQPALVYTSGSSLRPDVSGPGYWVFTPVRLADGSQVVVNRGFVPEGRQDPGSRADDRPGGAVDIVGVMRWPETRGLFTPNDEPGKNLWFVRDHVAMATAKGWGTVAPFFVEQEAPPPPGGLPAVGPVRPNLPNNHLQYALTWYALAVVLLAVCAVWMVNRR
jgi:surfeit locus 1 family protein